jgi:hypothetical protein
MGKLVCPLGKFSFFALPIGGYFRASLPEAGIKTAN